MVEPGGGDEPLVHVGDPLGNLDLGLSSFLGTTSSLPWQLPSQSSLYHILWLSVLVTSRPRSRRHPPASRGLSSGSYTAQREPATSYPFCPGGRWQLPSGIALLHSLEQSLMTSLWPAGSGGCRILSPMASSMDPVMNLSTSYQCHSIKL